MIPIEARTDPNGTATFQFRVPDNARPGPTLLTVGPLDPNNAATADGVIDIIIESSQRIDLAALGLRLTPVGQGQYEVTPVVGVNAGIPVVPVDWSLAVNGEVQGVETSHTIDLTLCPPPPCPSANCTWTVTSMGMKSGPFMTPCVDNVTSCDCEFTVELWPLHNVPIPPNAQLTLIVDPVNRLNEFNENNNVIHTQVPLAPILLNPRVNRARGMFQFEVQTAEGLLYRIESTPSLGAEWTPIRSFSGNGGLITMEVPLTPNANQFFQALAGGTLPTVKVDCGLHEEIYENTTAGAVTVSIQVTDKCEGLSSDVIVRDKDDEEVKRCEIRDGTTKTCTVTVPAGGTIDLDCDGGEGHCDYTLVVPP
jgi:hypothetical protein